jgi:hypothetical protein
MRRRRRDMRISTDPNPTLGSRQDQFSEACLCLECGYPKPFYIFYSRGEKENYMMVYGPHTLLSPSITYQCPYCKKHLISKEIKEIEFFDHTNKAPSWKEGKNIWKIMEVTKTEEEEEGK